MRLESIVRRGSSDEEVTGGVSRPVPQDLAFTLLRWEPLENVEQQSDMVQLKF